MSEFVFLCTVENAAESLIIMSILDADGIAYRIDTVAPNAYGLTNNFNFNFNAPVGPVSFYVNKSDYEKAKALLDEATS